LSLDSHEARRLVDHIADAADSDGLLPVAIVVVGIRGMVLCSEALAGTKPSSVQTALNKAVTVIYTERDTITFHHKQDASGLWLPDRDGYSQTDVLNLQRAHPMLVTWGGGVAVRNDAGEIVGAVGISGRTEALDHHLASSRPDGWSLEAPPVVTTATSRVWSQPTS
jgi:uncharacterized protein GlcG (DUF336 family)